jgi:hypothetical protein
MYVAIISPCIVILLLALSVQQTNSLVFLSHLIFSFNSTQLRL